MFWTGQVCSGSHWMGPAWISAGHSMFQFDWLVFLAIRSSSYFKISSRWDQRVFGWPWPAAGKKKKKKKRRGCCKQHKFNLMPSSILVHFGLRMFQQRAFHSCHVRLSDLPLTHPPKTRAVGGKWRYILLPNAQGGHRTGWTLQTFPSDSASAKCWGMSTGRH